jgi:hypothetical protein
MARGISAALNTEFNADKLRPIFFFKSVWASGTTYIWSGYGNISWDGQTWAGVGDLAGMTAIEETTLVRANGVKFTLAGVPSALVALALGQARQGTEVSLWVGAVDEDMNIIADPYKIFSGLMDVPGIIEGPETSTITIAAENRLIELERARELRWTDQFQQNRFAGDVGFQYIAGLQDKAIYWNVPSGPFLSFQG